MKYDIDKLTVNELFCGIGSQRKALERLGISHEVVGIAEIDKYAIQSYESIFGKTYNYGDISKVESLNYADLWTYSFPCTDLSVAGARKGFIDEDGNQTRSGLLYEVERLLDKAKETNTLPKLLLMENVKNLVGKEFKLNFDKFLCKLTSLGYNNYWQVLNSKDYGIPQNRERVFVVSIRKDIDKYGYVFPKKLKLTKVLKDVLENTVDDKYYLSETIQERFKLELKSNNIVGTTAPSFRTIGQRDIVYGTEGCVGALVATDYKQPKQILETHHIDNIKKVVCEQRCDEGLRFFKDEVVGALRTIDACGDKRVIELPCIGASRGRNPENPSDRTTGCPTEQRLEINAQGISNTITTVQKDNYVIETPIRLGNIYGNDKGSGFAGNVYDKNAISPTLMTMNGGNSQPMIVSDSIHKIDIPQTIRVRKHTINNTKLVELLRSHKNLSNKQIADALNVPITKVEHWFRTDVYFAVPDAEIWFKLKSLLQIETNEFDEAITTFEEKEGVFEKSNRCYLDSGIAPTLTSSSCDEKIVNDLRIRKLTPLECWRLMGFDDEDFNKAQSSGVSDTQLYKQAGNSIVVDCLYYIFKSLLVDIPPLKKRGILG